MDIALVVHGVTGMEQVGRRVIVVHPGSKQAALEEFAQFIRGCSKDLGIGEAADVNLARDTESFIHRYCLFTARDTSEVGVNPAYVGRPLQGPLGTAVVAAGRQFRPAYVDVQLPAQPSVGLQPPFIHGVLEEVKVELLQLAPPRRAIPRRCRRPMGPA